MIWNTAGYPNTCLFAGINFHINFANELIGITDYTQETAASVVQKAKNYLAAQYVAGTPVTVWYPLAEPVEEDWSETTYNENVYIPQGQ